METINGYPLIAQFHFEKRGVTRGGRVVIVDRGVKHDPRRYVVSANYATEGVFDSYVVRYERAAAERIRSMYPALQEGGV